MSTEQTVAINPKSVRALLEARGIDVARASIREMNNLVNWLEGELGVRFIRMEFGIPGLQTPAIAVRAEIEALRERRLGHVYAPFDGVPALKAEAARFARSFMNVELPPTSCVPTVGAMEGCFAGLALASRMRRDRRKVAFLEPGFPVNLLQARFLGLEVVPIDFHDYRGDALIARVEELAREDEISAVLWSSPNNPAWIALDESELAGLGRVCDEHDLIAIEDLAYFGMDTRHDYLVPDEPPYQPTILRHSRNAVSILSSSKIFSYAGQRVALTMIAPELMQRRAPDLEQYYGTAEVGHALIHGILYPIAACVPESPQYGLQALLQAANDGDRSVFASVPEYARRAKIMKRLFLEHGFRLVYDNDLGQPLGDGFYFTIAYPGFDDGAELLREMLCYGISAITLESTGSNRREGLRACVSLTGDELFPVLEERLQRFHADHG